MNLKDIIVPEEYVINYYVENHPWFSEVFSLITKGLFNNIENKLYEAVFNVLSTIEDLPSYYMPEDIRCYNQAKMLIRTKKILINYK